MNEDITFCDNKKCKVKRCFRNPKNIEHFYIPHSFASLEGTDYCPSFYNKESKRNKKRGAGMTNFEKIKAMTIEEMADTLNCIIAECVHCPVFHLCINEEKFFDCKTVIKKYLESEAVE